MGKMRKKTWVTSCISAIGNNITADVQGQIQLAGNDVIIKCTGTELTCKYGTILFFCRQEGRQKFPIEVIDGTTKTKVLFSRKKLKKQYSDEKYYLTNSDAKYYLTMHAGNQLIRADATEFINHVKNKLKKARDKNAD